LPSKPLEGFAYRSRCRWALSSVLSGNMEALCVSFLVYRRKHDRSQSHRAISVAKIEREERGPPSTRDLLNIRKTPSARPGPKFKSLADAWVDLSGSPQGSGAKWRHRGERSASSSDHQHMTGAALTIGMWSMAALKIILTGQRTSGLYIGFFRRHRARSSSRHAR
jgi:hypothetical protein